MSNKRSAKSSKPRTQVKKRWLATQPKKEVIEVASLSDREIDAEFEALQQHAAAKASPRQNPYARNAGEAGRAPGKAAVADEVKPHGESDGI